MPCVNSRRPKISSASGVGRRARAQDRPGRRGKNRGNAASIAARDHHSARDGRARRLERGGRHARRAGAGAGPESRSARRGAGRRRRMVQPRTADRRAQQGVGRAHAQRCERSAAARGLGAVARRQDRTYSGDARRTCERAPRGAHRPTRRAAGRIRFQAQPPRGNRARAGRSVGAGRGSARKQAERHVARGSAKRGRRRCAQARFARTHTTLEAVNGTLGSWSTGLPGWKRDCAAVSARAKPPLRSN